MPVDLQTITKRFPVPALATRRGELTVTKIEDALVVALEDAVTWLHLASQNQGTSPLITKRHQVEAAKIETVLEQVKNKRINQQKKRRHDDQQEQVESY